MGSVRALAVIKSPAEVITLVAKRKLRGEKIWQRRPPMGVILAVEIYPSQASIMVAFPGDF
jgi:hypothetical protein